MPVLAVLGDFVH